MAIHENLSQGSSRKFIVLEDKMDEYGRALCVRGYHVYREICEAAVGQYVTESHGTRRTGMLWRYKTIASLT